MNSFEVFFLNSYQKCHFNFFLMGRSGSFTFLTKSGGKIMYNRGGRFLSILSFGLHKINFEKHFYVNEVIGTRFRT